MHTCGLRKALQGFHIVFPVQVELKFPSYLSGVLGSRVLHQHHIWGPTSKFICPVAQRRQRSNYHMGTHNARSKDAVQVRHRLDGLAKPHFISQHDISLLCTREEQPSKPFQLILAQFASCQKTWLFVQFQAGEFLGKLGGLKVGMTTPLEVRLDLITEPSTLNLFPVFPKSFLMRESSEFAEKLPWNFSFQLSACQDRFHFQPFRFHSIADVIIHKSSSVFILRRQRK